MDGGESDGLAACDGSNLERTRFSSFLDLQMPIQKSRGVFQSSSLQERLYTMSQKRGGTFNNWGDDRRKRQKHHNVQTFNSLPHTSSNYNNKVENQAQYRKHGNKATPVLEHLERLPDPEKCEPCKLAAVEMETGVIALLAKLEAEERTPDGDSDVLHHARELRRLLLKRASKSRSRATTALDEKRPATDKYVKVPVYIERKLEQGTDLPPLPPITEPHLEEAVFTHVSHYGASSIRGVGNADQLTYERLEFLGDAYIELIASRIMFSRLPETEVPQQSYLREQLVRNETLARFSNAYALPDRLKHGGHLGNSKAWDKVVADVFEAYVAGVVLSDPENGFSTAEQWLTELWAPQVLGFKEAVVENPKAKDDIQRLIQVRGVKLDYREERAMVHENGVQRYFIGLYFTGWGYEDEWLGSGEGRNKAQAAVYAAMDALQRNNAVLQTAGKKKQELVQQTKDGKEQRREAKKEGKSEETGGDAAPGEDAPAEPSLSPDEEKKRKKKEKKEKREKKRKAESDDGSP